MEIHFKDKKLRKICENSRKLKKNYGAIRAKKIIKRLNELQAAKSFYDISRLTQPRLHNLSGQRKKQFAVDIKHPYRIILLPLNGSREDLKTITSIKIIEIIDYH
jgi:proteic killer suppression protein